MASLIILIVSLILLTGLSFLIFQNWLAIKEIKLFLPKMLEELKSYDSLLKETIVNSKNLLSDNIVNNTNSHSKDLSNLFIEKIESLKENNQQSINKNTEEISNSLKKLEQRIESLKDESKINHDNLYKAITEPLDL